MTTLNFTYDVIFNDSESTSSKGWSESYLTCLDYIKTWNGTPASYFKDYVGGTVSIVCNETEDNCYSEDIYLN